MTSRLSVPKEARDMAQRLKVLAHPLRLMIVCHLLGGELFAQELQDALGTTKGNISQHLTLLLRQKILRREKRGRNNYYRIADDNLYSLISHLKKLYCPTFALIPRKGEKS